MTPRHGRFGLVGTLILLACASSGCISPWTSKDDQEDKPSHEWDKVEVVGDLAVPGGLNVATVRAVSLVTQLQGTGSDPPPSPARDLLLNEMRIKQVEHPQQWLASNKTAIVQMEAKIPPGTKKGARIDVEVSVAGEDDTTSLANGWVPETRLTEMEFLGGRIRTGSEVARGGGPILLSSVLEGNETEANVKRGILPGGAMMMEDRPLGLGIVQSHASIAASTRVGAAINARFYMYREGSKKGVATPKTDKLIDLDIHPRYENNVPRYIRVIRQIPLATTTAERIRRMAELETLLLDESSSQAGALGLEAMGKEAIPSLKKGYNSASPLVRFCAAESLAYLNDPSCVKPLSEAARNNNGFRYRALLALGSYDDLEVIDALEGLLQAESAEARYGAFDQLKRRSPKLPSIAGTKLDNGVPMHFVKSASTPMIHFRLKDRAEIVIFGTEVRTNPEVTYIGPSGLTIRSSGHRQLKVIRFKANGEEIVQNCSNDVTKMIQAMVACECGYGEIVKTVFALNKQGFLDTRVEANAMPRPDRDYLRPEESGALGGDDVPSPTENFTRSEESDVLEQTSADFPAPTGDDDLIPQFD